MQQRVMVLVVFGGQTIKLLFHHLIEFKNIFSTDKLIGIGNFWPMFFAIINIGMKILQDWAWKSGIDDKLIHSKF